MNLYIVTLGCPKNVVDSENAAGLAGAAGHVVVTDLAEADAVLVNTCGFINDAKEESIDRILELAAHKKPGALLIVSGCLGQRYGEELKKAMPEIDVLLGVNDYQRLPEILREHEEGKLAGELFVSEDCGAYREMGPRRALSAPYTAFLRVAEGCDNRCAYCVIPQIRGPYRSRKREDVLAEASELAAAGCKELVIVAQDVTAYGRDLYGDYVLPELLTDLCRVDGVRWIRLMYCYEDRITDRLIQTMAAEEKICHYIDIPIQHASDKVLQAMRRRSTRASLTETIGKLRQAMPDIHIRTTLITGFPGETAADFRELQDFVETMQFQRLGVFSYSKEEGTAAAEMPGQVAAKTKDARRDKLLQAQQEISLKYNEEKIGQVMEVLVEGMDDEGCYIGRTAYDAPEIDNGVIFRADRELAPGDMVQVRITDAYDYDLVGELTDESTE